MRSDWNFRSLRDCIVHKKGFAFKSKDYDTSGIPIVKVTNLTNDSIDMSDVVYVNKNIAESNSSVALKKDDIIITTVGSWATNPASVVGKVIKVPIQSKGSLLNQNAVIIRPKNETINKKFLFFLLKHKSFSKYLVSNAQGSANQASITLNDIFNYETYIPPLTTQKKIAHILSTLNDKIELNRNMNQTLEEMAEALFKSWFVDFDPVHARANSKESDEVVARELGISVEVLKLFPSKFVESELGLIPEGWEVKKLSNLGHIITGKTPSKKIKDAYDNGDKPFITPTDIDNSMFVTYTNRHLSKNGQDAVKNSFIGAGSICVTCIGSKMGKTIIAPIDSFTNQQINSIIVFNRRWRNYLFCNLRNRKKEIFRMGSSGSTMPILNKSAFSKLPIILPNKEILFYFNEKIENILSLVLANDMQNIMLQKTRDTLLPKLLSGELDVSKIEEKIN